MAPPDSVSAQILINSLLILILIEFCAAADDQRYVNCSRRFACAGNSIREIKYPFWGGNRPPECGVSQLELQCSGDNSTTTIHIAGKVFRVLGIDPDNKTMRIAPTDNICSATFANTSLLINQKFDGGGDLKLHYSRNVENLRLLYSCSKFSGASSPKFQFSCPSSNGTTITQNYAVIDNNTNSTTSVCNQSITIPVMNIPRNVSAVTRVQDQVNGGFEVVYQMNEGACESCEQSGGLCWSGTLSKASPTCLCPGGPQTLACGLKKNVSNLGSKIVGPLLGAIFVLFLTLIAFWCYWKRPFSSTRSKNVNVENLLIQQGSLALKRYKYSAIKKITKSLSDKLGDGGHGSVYKGTLSDGSPVAVKLLAETNSNGEEFINEVASISKTSHVNIVTLVGFCYERNKRALVYEFMPNKSLDKFINKGKNPMCDGLDVEKLYKIAIGVARGLEYLHFGCNTRIVHFDVKPQNILLDEDFCPKISDFGLAKLCKKKQSMLSLLGMRGTVGYIAPEVFSGNFGRVSHKSDVYSYGMMILEILGSRNVVDEGDTNQFSENYFPDKIYQKAMLHIDPSRSIEDGSMIEEDDERIKTMYLVGFWCIQALPSDRPAMSKVVEMLEGNLQSMQIPPKPVLCHPKLSTHELSTYVETTKELTEGSQSTV